MRTLLALVLSLGTLPPSAAALTISDDTFLEADWSTLEVIDSGGEATFSTSQQLAGGDPASFRQTTHSIPGATQSIILDHVFSGAHYDPSADGAIASIDFALDVRFIGGSVGTSQVGHQLLLVQGGTHYNALGTAQSIAHGPGNGVPGPWAGHSFAGLGAASFTRIFGSGPDNPDFSSSGADIQFGYLTANTSIDSGVATTSGIDNWSVTVNPVPAPPASALVCAALLGLAIAGRTRRSACVLPRSAEHSR